MQGKGRSGLKTFFYALAALCILGGIVMAFVPAILSTSWGNERLLTTLNERIPGKVQAKSFSLSWFGVQQVRGLTLLDPEGNAVISFESFETETPLLSLLRNGPTGGNTRVRALNAEIKKTSSGKTNLQESLGNEMPGINFPAENPISLSNVNLDLDVSASKKQNMVLQTSGSTRQGNVSGKFNIDMQQSNAASRWLAEIDRFPTGILDGLLATQFPELKGLLYAIVGDGLDVNMTEESKNGQTAWKIQASSTNVKIVCYGNIQNGVFHLTEPAKMTLRMTPQAWKRLSPLNPAFRDWALAGSSDVVLDIKDLEIPINFIFGNIGQTSQDQFVLNGRVSIPQAELINTLEQNNRAKIQGFSLNINSSRESKFLTVNSEGELFYENTPVKYRLGTKNRKPRNLDDLIATLCQPSEINFTLNDVPSSLIDQIISSNDTARNAFGNKVTFHMNSSVAEPQVLRMSVISDKVDIPAILLKLDQDVTQTYSITDRDWSGEMYIEKINFKQSREAPLVHSITMPWKIRRGLQQFDVRFTGNTSMGNRQEGSFNGNATISTSGSFEDAAIKAEVNGNNVPAQFLEFISGRHEIGPAFGPSIKLDASVNLQKMNGSVKANLSGSNGQMHLNAFAKNGYLYLNEPFIAVTKGTRELGSQVLGEFAPAFNELISSEGQIRLTISPENFYLPINPFNLDQIHIASASLEMGKLTFQNAGGIKELLSVLRPARSEKITVWTTPLYFTLQEGVLNVYRMDMLIMDWYHIATWGKIDLIKDKVLMTIGVTGTALSNALEVDGLPPNTMVQIPVRGSISDAKIDSSKATSKIGALLAQSSGAPQGLVIGTVLDIASGKEAKVPPPTTDPLPWAGRDLTRGDRQTTEREQNSSRPFEKMDPVKEIQKEASKLLKGIFR